MGHAPEVLSESEHRKLRTFLTALRDDEDLIAEWADWILTAKELKRTSAEELLVHVMYQYVNGYERGQVEECDGVLIGHAVGTHLPTFETRLWKPRPSGFLFSNAYIPAAPTKVTSIVSSAT